MIHDRMPVLFTREAEWNAWLHPDAIRDELRKMLAPVPDDLLEAVPVSRDLLRVKEPGPDILAPIAV
jgi:putative SOS response-associated peptidase YedK